MTSGVSSSRARARMLNENTVWARRGGKRMRKAEKDGDRKREKEREYVNVTEKEKEAEKDRGEAGARREAGGENKGRGRKGLETRNTLYPGKDESYR